MRHLTTLILASFVLLSAGTAQAQSARYRFVSRGDVVQDKNFYLLTVLSSEPGARAALAADPVLQAERDRAIAALKHARSSCGSVACISSDLTLSDADIARIGDRLASLASGPLKPAIRDHLRPSGLYQRSAGLEDPAFLRAVWDQTARGMNRLYRVYGLGEPPLYPDIDSATYKSTDRAFFQTVRTALEVAVDGHGPDSTFFEPWSQIGLDLLLISQRDEAARFEPLATGENAAALQRASRTAWGRFSFSAIVVPGAGLRAEETGLSAAGTLRLRLAARRYQKGLAPFILVSGGNVHPNKTPYNEAIEMKRQLVALFGIPESAILVDPHARHTTTNLRNAARILFRAGAPMEQDVLVTTSESQSAYIDSEIVRARNRTELGYQPMTVSSRISPADLAMRPVLDSLHSDPTDPLDP
jgi:hypothetical protein